MRRHFASFFALALLTATPAFAVMEDYPSVRLQGLDKSVGRTVTFEARVGSTIQYGPLFIKIHACRKAPPIEKPESAAFLQIWEVPPGAEKSEWAFSGWMFASSPALSAMDHPVYDVWVLDCMGREEPNDEAAEAETTETTDQTELPAAQEKTPVDSEAIAEDMEAEPEPQPAPLIVPDENYPPVQSTDPDAAYSPQGQMPQPQTQEIPAPATAPVEERGMTAYDFMKQQQGTNAAPAPTPTPVPEQMPPQY